MTGLELFVLIYLLVLGNEVVDIRTLGSPKKLLLVAPIIAIFQSAAVFVAFLIAMHWISQLR